MPMHTLITDLIESQGGSLMLVKTLNRLGVCTSADSLARFIQHKRSVSKQHQFRHMSEDAFTVVSADKQLAWHYLRKLHSLYHHCLVLIAVYMTLLLRSLDRVMPQTLLSYSLEAVASRSLETVQSHSLDILLTGDHTVSLTGDCPVSLTGDTRVSLTGDTCVSLTGDHPVSLT